MFKSEYYEALIWHLSYWFVAIATGLLGIVVSAMLLGLDAVLRRLERLEAALDRPR